MSPRSAEFMDQAHERLRQAQHDVGEGFLVGAVSIAYYAMLYACRRRDFIAAVERMLDT